MKKLGLKWVFFLFCILLSSGLWAQCSICTKTAQQLGEKTGHGLNGAIVYLASAPLLLLGVIGYRWWKSEAKES